MDLKLSGKVAIVTGASIGVGRAIARSLAQEGARLAIVARGRERLEAAADALAAEGFERPLVLACDITQPDTPSVVRAAVLEAFGSADILVNNAGGSRPFEGLGTARQWEDAMALNFHAARELTHALIDDMRARGFGRIVNITGGDEPVAINGAVPPNGATHIWAKALSRHVAKDGITINSIPPGRIHSEQVDHKLLPTEEAQRRWVEENCPAGYIGEPEDLSALVAFLCSPLARYITGQVIHVDGGARRFSH
jgi:3-oxoacyl-[acyl-carrier protein] reductase